MYLTPNFIASFLFGTSIALEECLRRVFLIIDGSWIYFKAIFAFSNEGVGASPYSE